MTDQRPGMLLLVVAVPIVAAVIIVSVVQLFGWTGLAVGAVLVTLLVAVAVIAGAVRRHQRPRRR